LAGLEACGGVLEGCHSFKASRSASGGRLQGCDVSTASAVRRTCDKTSPPFRRAGCDREQVTNPTDKRLFDYYLTLGLFGDADSKLYERREILELVRAAYWFGVRDASIDPAGVAELEQTYIATCAGRPQGAAP
jgi:hypothetical protein